MKQKKVLILYALFLFWGFSEIKAQSNTLAAGGEAAGSGGNLSYSIGQVDYILATGSGGSASQGVQQPFEIFVLGIDDHPEINLEIVVYPNPTTSNLKLQIGNFPINELSYQLYDLQGRLLLQQKIRNKVVQIPMEGLATAVYLLDVTENFFPIKSFKIIKN